MLGYQEIITMASKKKAEAVDSALENLMGKNTKLSLTADFLRNWAQKARELGGSLSAERIRRAINKLGVKVTEVRKCAVQYMNSNHWFVSFA